MKLMKVVSLAAAGAGLMLLAPVERAQALSLINPGDAAAVQQGSRQLTEAHWHYHHHYHHHWRHHHWHHHHWHHHHHHWR
jgi:hypothetical protein